MPPFFNRRKKENDEQLEQGLREYFEIIPAYTAQYRTFDGGVYEMELTRAAIHTFANHCSKLKPEVKGAGNEVIQRVLQFRPNPLMDTKKYLYRIATITKCKNNAYIVPLYDEYRQKVTGFYPLHPDKCELKKLSDGKMWLFYELVPGQKKAIRFDKVGIINQFQNSDEIFGEGNNALKTTLELINAQNQGIVEGVQNSSSIKFLAKLGQSLKPDDVNKERDRFVKANLQSNSSGVMLIDAKYAEVKQLQTNQFTLDSKQMSLIKESVFDYFGTSETILQNRCQSSTEWNSYYEGQIEPFALELGLVHTNMLFTPHEWAFGNEVQFASQRLNYLSSNEKINLITSLYDRGFLSINEGREILNLTPIDGGDDHIIRKEYAPLTTHIQNENGDSNPFAEEPVQQEPNEEGFVNE